MAAIFRHVHAYERCNRVYNYTVDPCGPIHVTIGDGGMLFFSFLRRAPGWQRGFFLSHVHLARSACKPRGSFSPFLALAPIVSVLEPVLTYNVSGSCDVCTCVLSAKC